MSTPFYDLASLVVVPSGYKASKVYAQKPLTTDGQLTFSRASTATRVNSAGLIETVSSNVPRLDYLGSTCPKLQLEPSRTNLVTYSEQIDNASWIKSNSPTITTNIATAPDGTVSADGLQAADAVNYKYIAKSLSVSANSTVTFSFFVKKETSETAFGGFTMYFQGSTAKIVYGIVNAVTGTVTYAASTLTPTTKVEDYGTYWRIASTATDNGSNTLCEVGYYATLSTNGTSLNTGVSSVRTVWGFQAEIGAYATSYIPTTTAAVTRLADYTSKTSSSLAENAKTWFCDVNITQGRVEGSSEMFLTIRGGGYEGYFRYFASNQLHFQYYGATSSAQIVLSSAIPAGTTARVKMAARIENNDMVFYVNGAQIGANTTATRGTGMNILEVGTYGVNAGYHISDSINQLILFPTALTNAQLAELTTL